MTAKAAHSPEDEQLAAGLYRGFAVLAGLAVLEIAAGCAIGTKPVSFYLLPQNAFEFFAYLLPLVAWPAWLAAKAHGANTAIIPNVRREVSEQRGWFLRGFLIYLLLLPVMRAFSAIKSAIPALNPSYADNWFAEVDRALFLGVEPWQITHALIGPTGTVALDLLYILWFPMAALLFIATAFARDPVFQLRASLSHLATWIVLGSLLAVALSSVGPCYVEPLFGDQRFVPLTDRLREQPLFMHENHAYLLAAYGQEVRGGGISAMPSLHVALAALLHVLCRDRFGARHWAGYASLVYAVLIWIGSVHLAWHYAVDGIVSALGVVLIWRLSTRLVPDGGDRKTQGASYPPAREHGLAEAV